MSSKVQRAIDKQAKLEADGLPFEIWMHFLGQAKLARAVIEAAESLEFFVRQRSDVFNSSNLREALAAWADHVNGDDV